MVNERVQRAPVNKWKIATVLLAVVLIAMPFGLPLLLISDYYSEKNLLLIERPLENGDPDSCKRGTIDFVLPKGVYQCSLVIRTNYDGLGTIKKGTLSVRCEFPAQVDGTRTEQLSIPFSPSLFEKYISEYDENRDMYLRTGERVLPSPWTYTEFDDAGTAKFPIGRFWLESHGLSRQVTLEVCGDERPVPGGAEYFLRLERFIDAV